MHAVPFYNESCLPAAYSDATITSKLCEVTWQEDEAGDLPPLVELTRLDSIERLENGAPCGTFALATPTLRDFIAEQETVGRLQANEVCNLHRRDTQGGITIQRLHTVTCGNKGNGSGGSFGDHMDKLRRHCGI